MVIRGEDDLDLAIREIDSLLDRERSLSASDRKRLETLSKSVLLYESVNYREPSISGSDLLRHLLQLHDLTPNQLAEVTGVDEAAISAILSGERDPSAIEARKLASHFRLCSSAFGNSDTLEY